MVAASIQIHSRELLLTNTSWKTEKLTVWKALEWSESLVVAVWRRVLFGWLKRRKRVVALLKVMKEPTSTASSVHSNHGQKAHSFFNFPTHIRTQTI
jgi:hypothetical protein